MTLTGLDTTFVSGKITAVLGLALIPVLLSVRVRVRRGRRPRLSPAVAPASLLSFSMLLAGAPIAYARKPVPIKRSLVARGVPWSEASGYSPPRSLARTRIRTPIHPAIHKVSRDRSAIVPLFPRAGTKEDAMRRHPSGKGLASSRRYVVKSGDTLWGIAATVLRTNDQRRIARYWPLIHRENVALIGPNPNLIFPGQVLLLPTEGNQ